MVIFQNPSIYSVVTILCKIFLLIATWKNNKIPDKLLLFPKDDKKGSNRLYTQETFSPKLSQLRLLITEKSARLPDHVASRPHQATLRRLNNESGELLKQNSLSVFLPSPSLVRTWEPFGRARKRVNSRIKVGSAPAAGGGASPAPERKRGRRESLLERKREKKE